MIILSADKKTVVNTDYVTKVYTGGESLSIRCNLAHGEGSELARYSNTNIVKYVLESLAIAMSHEDSYYYFPSEAEAMEKLNAAKMSRSHVKTEKNRHGGS